MFGLRQDPVKAQTDALYTGFVVCRFGAELILSVPYLAK